MMQITPSYAYTTAYTSTAKSAQLASADSCIQGLAKKSCVCSIDSHKRIFFTHCAHPAATGRPHSALPQHVHTYQVSPAVPRPQHVPSSWQLLAHCWSLWLWKVQHAQSYCRSICLSGHFLLSRLPVPRMHWVVNVAASCPHSCLCLCPCLHRIDCELSQSYLVHAEQQPGCTLWNVIECCSQAVIWHMQ